jgi:hypothetical protein
VGWISPDVTGRYERRLRTKYLKNQVLPVTIGRGWSQMWLSFSPPPSAIPHMPKMLLTPRSSAALA